MKKWLMNSLFRMKNKAESFLKDESGEANIIAIILVIIVVIALVAIFQEQLTNIVNDLFTRIRESLGL